MPVPVVLWNATLPENHRPVPGTNADVRIAVCRIARDHTPRGAKYCDATRLSRVVCRAAFDQGVVPAIDAKSVRIGVHVFDDAGGSHLSAGAESGDCPVSP